MIPRIWRRAINALDIVIEFLVVRPFLSLTLATASVIFICLVYLSMSARQWLAGLLVALVGILFVGLLIYACRRPRKSGQNYHAGWAKNYDNVNERSFGSAYDHLTEATLGLVSRLGSKLSIIDFGAGTGRLSIPLATAGHSVTAVDPSQAMLDELKRKDSEIRVALRQASIADYNGRGEFDLALAVHTVVSYITEVQVLHDSLANVASKLKEGGRFVIDVPQKGAFRDVRISRDGFTRSVRFVAKNHDLYEYHEETALTTEGETVRYTDDVLLRCWKEEELIDALRGAGFTDIRRVTASDLKEPEDMAALDFCGAIYLICKKPAALKSTTVKVLKICLLVALGLAKYWQSEKRKEQEMKLNAEISAAITAHDTKSLIKLGRRDKTLRSWEAAGNLGSQEAQLLLAEAFMKGNKTQADPDKAVTWATKAATSGSAEGALLLSTLYLDHQGVVKDAPAALRWTLVAARQLNKKAMLQAVRLYHNGIGTEKNDTLAYMWAAVLEAKTGKSGQSEAYLLLVSDIEKALTAEQKAESRRMAEQTIRELSRADSSK